MTERRFPPPWTVVPLPGGFKVVDAQGQSIAYVYSRESEADAGIAKVLTEDEARRIASNIAKLPGAARRGGSIGFGFSRWGRLVGVGFGPFHVQKRTENVLDH